MTATRRNSHLPQGRPSYRGIGGVGGCGSGPSGGSPPPGGVFSDGSGLGVAGGMGVLAYGIVGVFSGMWFGV